MAQYKIDDLCFKTETENEIKFEELKKIKSDEYDEYRLKICFDNEISPKVYSLVWEENQVDILGFWSPTSFFSSNITPDWGMRKQESRTSFAMPLISLYNKSNLNRITIVLSDPANPVSIMTGVIEETGKLKFQIDLFSKICPKMKEYEVIIRIDRRKITFADAVISARKWLEDFGYKSAVLPEKATMPMYSTWYSFHQNVSPSEIIKECKIAKEYGMETVIVDDGWQTDDNSRGYAYCGDWKISENKIPDMKEFVDEIHKLGMKFIIWFSVPFVGFESENYEKFKGMYLRTRENMSASVLDPRFKEVRDFLSNVYCSYVEKYGWDGLKLDFIDAFQLEEGSSKDYENMDFISLEEAIEKLLDEVTCKLKKINPEFMIEFRQGYIGPIVAKYGNLFRVLDCPNDSLTNRICSLGLRLTSSKTAVHSDMIMWSKEDTNESVMYQLLAIMFAVPQISIRFDNITDEHKKLLKNYLDFWREHRDTLLNGKIEVSDVEANFSMAKSTKDGQCVAVLYQKVVFEADSECVNYVFNSTGNDGIYIETKKDAKCEIYDIFGEKIEVVSVKQGISKINLPNGAMAKIY